MKFFSLVLIIFTVVYAGVSCTQPNSQLGSESSNNDNDDDDDDDGDDRRSARTCSDRDSCQDICDDMFSYTTERSDCYELNYADVNTIAHVWDVFSREEVNLRKLEDLSPDDVKSFLEIGLDSFIALVAGEAVGDNAKDNNRPQWNPTKNKTIKDTNIPKNSRHIMKWLAEDEDIAEVILEQDSNFELGLELFISVGDREYKPQDTHDSDITPSVNITLSNPSCHTTHFTNNNNDNNISSVKCNAGSGDKLFELTGFTDAKLFLEGFTVEPVFLKDRFMTFAADERNEKAVEWGHKTLLEFCKEGTNEDEDDVETKTCLQAVYCIHRSKENDPSTSPSAPADSYEGIFKDLENYDDIVGRTDEESCDELNNDDRMEDLFD